jgi:hypothetical protein
LKAKKLLGQKEGKGTQIEGKKLLLIFSASSHFAKIDLKFSSLKEVTES